MAGSYPDAPSRRMAWDVDGSVLFYRSDAAALNEADSVLRSEINSEETAGTGPSTNNWYLIFPELRELDGVYVNRVGPSGTIRVDVSGDTTNGIDGAWSTEVAAYSESEANNVYDTYRVDIVSTAASSVRGVWLDGDFTDPAGSGDRKIKAFHVYGDITPGETPDRLLWVDNNTGSEFGLPIDYGDIPRGSAEDREVLLRNNSGSLTAATVQITAEALYLNSGAWYTFKEAGGGFQATLPLSTSIGAGSDSPVLTIRRVTPDTETLGLHASRAVANVGSWS